MNCWVNILTFPTYTFPTIYSIVPSVRCVLTKPVIKNNFSRLSVDIIYLLAFKGNFFDEYNSVKNCF